MRIVLVEDDPLQADWIQSAIEGAFTGADVQRLATASAFIAEIAVLEHTPPAILIVDEMLRWADPPTIDDVERGVVQLPPPAGWRSSRAGVDLIHRALASAALRDVPMILYTVLEKNEELPPTVRHLTKNADASTLIDVVRSLVPRRR